MDEKTYEKNLNALNAGIAKSSEEIAALAAGLKKLAEGKIDESFVEGEQPREGPTNGANGHSGWTGFRNKIGKAGARGESVAKGLADEMERHPLIGGIASFGLGFVIARLLFRRRKRDSSQ